MQIKLGEKIKSLRKRDGRRQDDLAAALGVTNQAVSRWEANKGYPDMEMIPAIANYFHVSIDELFGYNNDRETRLSAYLDEFETMREKDGGKCKATLEEQEEYLRKALSEFPNEWQLQMRLAWVSESKAAMANDDDRMRILKEAQELYEQAYKNTDDTGWRNSILLMIADNCNQTGDAEKIERYAAESAPATVCREVLRTRTPDEKKKKQYYAEAVLALLHELTWLIEWTPTDDPELYVSLSEFYKRLFSDGNYGMFASNLRQLCLRSAKGYAENGSVKKALEFFDAAYDNHIAYTALWDKKENKLTAPLLSSAVELPSRYIWLSNDNLRNFVSTLPDNTASAIRENPKYAAIFNG